MDNEPTLTLPDGSTHKVADLSDEVKELLAIHETAQIELNQARRSAAIHEIALTTTANVITQKITQPDEPEDDAAAT